MAKVELIMPKMAESVSEATIITWNKNIGDQVELDETIIEIATDKVDSEVPSTHEGKLVEMLFQVDDVVQVGEPFGIIEVEAETEVLEKKEEKIEESSNTEINAKEHVEEISSSNKLIFLLSFLSTLIVFGHSDLFIFAMSFFKIFDA